MGGLPATNVNVTNYNTITLTTPALPAGTINDITVTNTDGTNGTLANAWIVNFLDVPESQQFNFYVNDAPLGRMFVRMCPYFPFSARVCLNQDNWLAIRMLE